MAGYVRITWYYVHDLIYAKVETLRKRFAQKNKKRGYKSIFRIGRVYSKAKNSHRVDRVTLNFCEYEIGNEGIAGCSDVRKRRSNGKP